MHTHSARVCYVTVLVSVLEHDGAASLLHLADECSSALDAGQGCYKLVVESPLGHSGVAYLPHLTYPCSCAHSHAVRLAPARWSPACRAGW